jgi:uncharacterized protein YdhG (YjbR/CyaY superfamily)
MLIHAATPEEYIESLPEDRKEIIKEIRSAVKDNLPEGFEETTEYGMITYYVPHSIYPKGYHVNPKDPLPFMAIASQKNHIAVYHMGIYMDNELLSWFIEEYEKAVPTKLDMGKSCIRFKNTRKVPVELIGRLSSKLTTDKYIKLYEESMKTIKK